MQLPSQTRGNTLEPSGFVQSLPKAELHLHLEGTVDPETLALLSRKHPTPLQVRNPRYRDLEGSGRVLTEEDARTLYQYVDFGGFLLAFKAVSERLRDPEDYEHITYNMIRKLAGQGVVYAEVYASVGIVLWRGHEFDPLFDGMELGRERGERDFGVRVRWIFDAARHFGVEEARRVLEKAIQFRSRNVIGIGIGGDEARGPAEMFRDLYAEATRNGLHRLAHAGESVGPESIWSALRNLNAERIGHGLRAIDDPALVKFLAETGTPVEVCVTSNVRTNCCSRLQDHPVRRLFDAGVRITIASDDPDMFGTSIAREYQLLQEAFDFSNADLEVLARNSFQASFLSPEERPQY